MSDQSNSLSKELETLFKKTTEANRVFISEGTKFVKELNFSKKGGEEMFSKQTDLMKEAFNLFMKLNIQHASNLVDLGIALSRKFNDPGGAGTPEEPVTNEPAFVLQVSGQPGATANTLFLLDSDKKENIICNFKQTDYTLQDDASGRYTFETIFTPQSFEILPGQSQKVEITVKIPAETKQGQYRTNILVQGFEHTYFSLFLTVTPKKATTPKTKRKK